MRDRDPLEVIEPAIPSGAIPSTPSEDSLDEGPYGLRGKHTPPLLSMFGAYGIIFGAAIVLPFLLFLLVRFVIL